MSVDARGRGRAHFLETAQLLEAHHEAANRRSCLTVLLAQRSRGQAGFFAQERQLNSLLVQQSEMHLERSQAWKRRDAHGIASRSM